MGTRLDILINVALEEADRPPRMMPFKEWPYLCRYDMSPIDAVEHCTKSGKSWRTFAELNIKEQSMPERSPGSETERIARMVGLMRRAWRNLHSVPDKN